MVRFNSAIRELCKESKLSTPTDPSTLPIPGFNDSLPSLQDPFPDFDPIEDWLIDPYSVMMQPSGIQAEKPVGSDPKEAEFSFSEETHRGIIFENPCPEGYDLKIAGVGNLEETQQGNGGKDVGGLDGSAIKTEELWFSRETDFKNVTYCADFGVLGSSIEEEMEKVNLVGAHNGISLDSEVPSGEIDASVTVEECEEIVTSKENSSKTSGANVPDSTMNMETTTEKSVAKRDEMASDGDESDSGVSESDDGSDSSSSSSSKEEEEEEEEMKDDIEVEEGEIRDLDREDLVLSSGDEEEAAVKGPVKSKHEVEILPPVPPVNAVLEPHHQTLPVGVILSIMGAKVIVEGAEKHNPLNEGSILWVTETRLPLGLIDEIFGPVKNPYYVVRYNSEEEIPPGICEGTAVSFVAEFANHILNYKDLYKKGYDASGEHDEENSDEVEFSDDEKEAEYKRSQRMARRGKDDRKQASWEFTGQKKAQTKGGFCKNIQRSVPSSQGSMGPPGQTGGLPNFIQSLVQGSQEFSGQKKVQTKGGFRKNIQCSVPSSQGSVGPPGPTGGLPNFIPSPVQGPSLPVLHGCSSSGCSHGPAQVGAGGPLISHMTQPMGYLGGPSPHLLPQSNPIQFNGMPLQQQQICSPTDFSMTGMQQCRQPDHCHHNHQHQLQMFMGFPNGIPCQTQFNPNQMPLATGAPPFGNLSMGPIPTSMTGTTGLGCFNQMPFGMGIQSQGHCMHSSGAIGEQRASSGGQFLPPIVQGGFYAPQQFSPGSPGMASNRGRWRPPRGGRSNFSGGRGPK